MSDENQALFWSPPQDKMRHLHKGQTPTREPLHQVNAMRYAPDTPPEKQMCHINSDDLLRTSEVTPEEASVDHISLQQARAPVVLVGGRDAITLGRAGTATIKIGKRNRQISRIHATIEYNQTAKEYQLIVQGLNGVVVDGVPHKQHARVSLKDHSLIDILGLKIEFMYPNMSAIPSTDAALEEDILSIDSPLSDVPELLDSAVLDSPELDTTSAHCQDDAKSQAAEPKNCGKMSTKQSGDAAVQGNTNNDNDNDYSEVIIDALVFSRKSSMSISDICSRVMATNPVFSKQSRDMWITRIEKVLREKPFFGEIVRKGKTADGSPKENLYYYNSEKDPVEWRRTTYTQVGRSARKCTLQDKQYFWKIPPKLVRNRNAYVPPPAEAYENNNPETEAPSKRSKGKKTDDAEMPKKLKTSGNA